MVSVEPARRQMGSMRTLPTSAMRAPIESVQTRPLVTITQARSRCLAPR